MSVRAHRFSFLSSRLVTTVSLLASASLSAACVGEVDDNRAAVDEGGTKTDPPPESGPPETAPISHFVRSPNPIPGQYIVVMRDDVAFAAGNDMTTLSATLATSYSADVSLTFKNALRGFVAHMNEDAAIAMSTDPMVAFVEEDGLVEASTTQSNAVFGLDRIDQNSLPLDGAYTFNASGQGVTAYVIDTGIRITHQEFGNRASAGFTAINDGRGSDDCNGHGTHVAGTIGGTTFGVAKNVNLVAVRVLGCNGSGANSGVIAGVDFVTANAVKPAVANMSLGGGASAALDQAVRRSIQSGVVYAVAAGNENTDACGGSPARTAEAITVGATTSTDARASFSNFGTCVDIFAPGQGIKSSSNGSDTATATLSGTSMATPHVAGAAALFLSANPGATPAQVASALTDNASANQVRDVKGSPNKLLFVGFIGAGQNPEPPPPTDPPPTQGTPNSGTDTRSVALGRFVNYAGLPVLPGTPITVTLSGNVGDADLYVRFDAQPTLTRFDCRPFLSTSNEQCTGTVPAGVSQVFFSVNGFTAATYTLQASWVEP